MYKVIGDMVFIYNSKGIPMLHGYMNHGETIEQYLCKHRIAFINFLAVGE